MKPEAFALHLRYQAWFKTTVGPKGYRCYDVWFYRDKGRGLVGRLTSVPLGSLFKPGELP